MTVLAILFASTISSKAVADQIKVINCTAVKNIATVLVSNIHTVSIYKDPNKGICRFSIDGAVETATSPWSTKIDDALAGFETLQKIYQQDVYVQSKPAFHSALDNLKSNAIYLMSAAGPNLDGEPLSDLSKVLEKNGREVQGCFEAFYRGDSPNISSTDGHVTCKTIQDSPRPYLELTATPYESDSQTVLYTYR